MNIWVYDRECKILQLYGEKARTAEVAEQVSLRVEAAAQGKNVFRPRRR